MWFGKVPEGGAAIQKSQVRCLVLRGADRRLGIRGAEPARRSVAVEQVSDVGRGLVMEDCVGEDFELDPLWGWEPTKVLEDRGVMLSR